MIDVRANNYLLPLREESHDVPYVLTLGIQARAKMERTVIYNQLRDTFWDDRFRAMSYVELIELCNNLRIIHRKRAPKALYAAALTDYFREIS